MSTIVRHFVRIPGQPVAKGRPRFTRSGQVYAHPGSMRWEELAAIVLRSLIGTPMHDQPLRLEVVAYFKRPANLCRKKDSAHRIPHAKKPDADNILKNAADALVRAGVVIDDSVICQMICTKYYAAKGQEPETVILLDSFHEQDATP